MALSMDHQDELRDLLDRMREGQLESDAEQRLIRRASGDPEVAHFIVEYLDLCASLEWQHAPVAWRHLLEDPRDQSPAAINLLAPRSDDPDGELSEPDNPTSSWLYSVFAWRHRWLVAATVMLLAAVVAIAGMAGGYWLARGERAPRAPSDHQREFAPGTKPNTQLESAVATVLRTTECVFEPGSPRVHAGDRLRPGFQLKLAAGFVGIVFDDGTRVIVGGPAAFRIDSAGRGQLDYGELLARVDTITGFTVAVGDMQVVDRGTQFGIRVDKNGAAELYTLEGAIDLVPSAADPTSPESPADRMVAGDVTRLVTEGAISWEEMSVDPEHLTDFMRMVAAAGGGELAAHRSRYAANRWTVVFQDNFSAPELNPSHWQVVAPKLPAGVRAGTSRPSATPNNGQLELINGCILQTAEQFDATEKPVHLKVRWTVANPGDHVGVLMRGGQHRTDVELGKDFEVGGVRCYYEPNGHPASGGRPAVVIVTQAGGENGKELAYDIAPFAGLQIGKTYEYDITDDGHTITFTVRELGLIGRSATVSLDVPKPSTRNHILLHNHVDPKVKERRAFVDWVVIESAEDRPADEPDDGDS